MNASIVPFEAASKHSNGGTIWPPGKTSMWNRPLLISSTTFANCSAVPCTSSERVQAVDIRHWTFGCAMTLGASTMAAAATVATARLAFARNRRRSVITPSLPRFYGLRSPTLFNNLVGPQQERPRDRQPKRLRRLEVDDQLELRGLLHREFAWLSPIQDLIHIRSGTSPPVCEARPVGHEAASVYELSYSKYGRQPILLR